jgi:hypothetical protein
METIIFLPCLAAGYKKISFVSLIFTMYLCITNPKNINMAMFKL